MHGFNANKTILEKLLQYNNIMFSFNQIDINHETRRIEQIPYDKILVETDAKPNIVLSEIVNKISNIKQNKNIWDIIYNNSLRIINNG